MTTYLQRELAGVSPITQPALPTESKHTLDDRRDEARLHRREAKELRILWDYPIMEYKKWLAETLDNRNIVMQQLREWNYDNISSEKALHVPYKRAA